MDTTNKLREYMRNEGLNYQISTENVALLVAKFLHSLNVYIH